jgi:hypothetical protein
MAPSSPYYDFKLFRYVPSLPAALVATILFGLLSAAHIFKLFRHKTYFCIPFIIGGLFETIGYIGRILAHSNNTTLGPYIIQSLLILLGPALFAASIYMTLSRIIHSTHNESLAMLPIRWQTRLFVMGDVLAFLTQMLGGGLQAVGTLAFLHTGEKIILAGLLVQIVFFGCFIATSTVFHRRCRKSPTAASVSAELPWERMICMLYAVSLLIMVRSIFRVIDYIQGNSGYLLRIEWPLYVFDATLMIITMVIFLVWYPSGWRKGKSEESFDELRSLG